MAAHSEFIYATNNEQQSKPCTVTRLVCSTCEARISIVLMIAQVEKAPQESYADVGGLEQQIMEIKEAVELPLTHPELYEDIGIKPPKVPAFAYFPGAA